MKATPARRRASAQSGVHPAVRASAPVDDGTREFGRSLDAEPSLDHPSDGEPSLEELYRVASAAIRRVLGPGHAESDDLVQKSLERVVRSLKTRRFSGDCSLPTWVTIVARHVAIDEQRAQRSLDRAVPRSQLPMAGVAAPHDFESQLEARSLLAQATRVLASMDPQTADIIVMHDFTGHSLSEIAETTQLSVSAAQSRLVRGRKTFIRRLVVLVNPR